MIRKIAIAVFCIACFACLQDNKAALEEYNKEIKEAVTAELVEDWPNAEKHYTSALAAARKMKWVAGTAAAEQKLGDVCSRSNKIAAAETYYVEAKDICRKDWTCKGIDELYQKLILFYIYYGRQPDKAQAVMDEMVSIKERLNDGGDLKFKFRGYVSDMRTAGFDREADRLMEHINQMP
jgi:tetratricopeptide (TPR) repeat protein